HCYYILYCLVRHSISASLLPLCCLIFVFFFQAEDGIRDFHVTGVQTCALPISGSCGKAPSVHETAQPPSREQVEMHDVTVVGGEIGRASCRERGQGPGRGG